jgi:hypothetical protein
MVLRRSSLATYFGELVAIRGADCSEIWRVPSDLLENLAAADLDGDGFPEIVAVGRKIIQVLARDGTVIASATPGPSAASGANASGTDAPAIASLGDGKPPAILIGTSLYRYVPGNQQLQLLRQLAPPHWGGLYSVFADVNGDGAPEAIIGSRIYDAVSGAELTPSAMSGAMQGVPGIADFNHDGKPDVVNVEWPAFPAEPTVSIYDPFNDRQLFQASSLDTAPYYFTNLPSIADVDSDGIPEIAIATTESLSLYSLRCGASPPPADCAAAGILWRDTFQDLATGGSSVLPYDLNGDGFPEIVYRDDCWLRIFDAADGSLLFAMPVGGLTIITDGPIIADVDGDGHADLVVPANSMDADRCKAMPEATLNVPWQAPYGGLLVLSNPGDWVATRRLWTSTSYHITEINDDYSVPAVEEPSWRASNTYRTNTAGPPVERRAIRRLPMPSWGWSKQRFVTVALRPPARVSPERSTTVSVGSRPRASCVPPTRLAHSIRARVKSSGAIREQSRSQTISISMRTTVARVVTAGSNVSMPMIRPCNEVPLSDERAATKRIPAASALPASRPLRRPSPRCPR